MAEDVPNRKRKRRSRRREIRLLDEEAELVVRFAYDEVLKDNLKRIPSTRWSPDDRSWRVPARHVSELLELVAEEKFTIDDAVKQLAARGGHNARMRQLRRASRRDSLTPVTLNARVHDLLRDHLPQRFWIIGEVNGWKDNGYFEIIERYEDEHHPRAVTRAFVSEAVFRRFRQHLARIRPPLRWEDGLVVRLEVRLRFWERSGGIRLNVLDIDPDYTIILLNKRREAALRTLDEEGISEQNLDRPLSPVPLRIALLTSDRSEAARDFIDELRRSGYGFQVDLFDVRVQGDRLASSVCGALDAVASRAAQYDATVIVRGGGSRVDLSGFDQIAVGRAVCLHPLPVLVGIGHHRDHALLDDLARSFKTPTAVGAALVEMVHAFRGEIRILEEQIVTIASRQVALHRTELDGVAQRLAREAHHQLRAAERQVEDVRLDIVRSTRGRMRRERSGLDALIAALPERWRRRARRERREVDYLEGALSPQRRLMALRRETQQVEQMAARMARAVAHRLRSARAQIALMEARRAAADPSRVLERGFAIVSRENGELVRDARTVPPGQRLQVRVKSGQLTVERTGEDVDE